MKYANPLLGLLLVFLSACGGNAGEEEIKATQLSPSDDLQVYQLDLNGPKASLFELIEKAEIMRLEETEESLLSYVGRVIDVGDEYIFSSGKEGDIYYFTNTGEFKGKVNRKGEGPEEYGSIQSLWVEEDSVFVYSEDQKSIKQYLSNGEFIKSWSIAENGSQIVPFKDGYAMDMNDQTIDDSLAYRIVLFDRNFNRQTVLAPFNANESQLSVSTSYNGFYAYKKGLAYLHALSDTLFFLEGKTVKPLAKFDFGKDWLWNDLDFSSQTQQAYEAMQKRGLVWNLNAQIHPRWLLIDYVTDFSGDKTIVIDRMTGDYRHVNYRISGKDPASFVTLRWEGDKLFCSMSSSLVADFIEELGEDRWEMRTGTTLEEIESSENPVLLWMKFKDQFPN